MPSEKLLNVFKTIRSRSVEKRKEPTASENTRVPIDTSYNGLKTIHEGPNPTIDVVAIHGLNGHRDKTWTAANDVLWLRDLLPQRLPRARIMAWGYDASTHGRNPISAQYLHDHADTLVSDLCLERALTLTQRRPIIFLAHSLGGLVLKSALIHSAAARAGAQEDHHSIYLSTYGIIFAGTPHQGGEGVNWGVRLVTIASMFVNTNNNMLQHLQRDSEEVQRLMRDFAPISNDFRTKFVYETLETTLPTGTSIMVVPKASAVVPGLADVEPIALHKDHSNLVKFVGSDDDGYQTLSGHMHLMAESAGPQIRARWARYSAVSGKTSWEFNLPHDIRLKFKLKVQYMIGPSQFTQSSQVATPGLPANPSLSVATTPSSSEARPSVNMEHLPSTGRKISGWTILHATVNNKSSEGVKAILSVGSDPNCKTNEEAWTPLWVAAFHGLLGITHLLLDAGAKVNATTRNGCTALKEASEMGATEVVRLLIENGANVDLASHDFQVTPLIVAAGKNHVEVVRLLLAAGANPRAQQCGGWSALHYALMNKNKDMTNLILAHSPDVNASTRPGTRPLHLAAWAGYTDTCTRLLDLGAEMEAKESGGLTALRVSVQEGQLDTVKMLVERGAGTDVVGADGHSLMEVALMSGHVNVYRYLEEQPTR